MFVLLFLNFCKKNWKYFVLLFLFFYELLYYYFLFKLFFFGVKFIVRFILFNLNFLFNIFSIYLNFYYYFFIYIVTVLFDLTKMCFLHLAFQQNVFILFIFTIFFLFLIKIFIYLFILINRKLLLIFFTNLKFYLSFVKNYLINDYNKVKHSILYLVWRNLTTFLRIKHYKASIFFLYVLYMGIVIYLFCMNFNPVF